MKKQILLVLFIAISISAYQQDVNPRFLIEGSGLMTKYSGINNRQGIGASFDMFLGKRVSTHYVAYFGKDYFEMSPGIVSLPFIVLFFSGDGEVNSLEDLGVIAFLFAVSFENISLHFKLSDDMYLSPSISLFRLKYFYEAGDTGKRDYFCMSGSAGLKLNQRIGRNLTIGAFAEGGVLYTKGNPIGFNAGINIGFYLPGRDY